MRMLAVTGASRWMVSSVPARVGSCRVAMRMLISPTSVRLWRHEDLDRPDDRQSHRGRAYGNRFAWWSRWFPPAPTVDADRFQAEGDPTRTIGRVPAALACWPTGGPEALRAALAALPDPWRRVVILRDVEGLPPAEVSAVTGLTAEQQRDVLNRARELLRESLGPAPEHDEAMGHDHETWRAAHAGPTAAATANRHGLARADLVGSDREAVHDPDRLRRRVGGCDGRSLCGCGAVAGGAIGDSG